MRTERSSQNSMLCITNRTIVPETDSTRVVHTGLIRNNGDADGEKNTQTWHAFTYQMAVLSNITSIQKQWRFIKKLLLINVSANDIGCQPATSNIIKCTTIVSLSQTHTAHLPNRSPLLGLLPLPLDFSANIHVSEVIVNWICRKMQPQRWNRSTNYLRALTHLAGR